MRGGLLKARALTNRRLSVDLSANKKQKGFGMQLISMVYIYRPIFESRLTSEAGLDARQEYSLGLAKNQMKRAPVTINEGHGKFCDGRLPRVLQELVSKHSNRTGRDKVIPEHSKGRVWRPHSNCHSRSLCSKQQSQTSQPSRKGGGCRGTVQGR